MLDMNWAGLFMTGPVLKTKAVISRIPLEYSRVCRTCGKDKRLKYYAVIGYTEEDSPKFSLSCQKCLAIIKIRRAK